MTNILVKRHKCSIGKGAGNQEVAGKVLAVHKKYVILFKRKLK